MTLELDPVLITAFALALVRTSAWLFVAPPFNTRLVPITVKAGLAAALAVAAAPRIADPELSMETGPFLGALLVQVVTGIVLGLITLLLFNAIQAAGALIDTFAGLSMASLVDPTSNAQTTTFGQFYQLVGFTLLFATNGHLILVDGLFRSFEAVPASGFPIAEASSILTHNVGPFLIAAIEIAAPVLACLFLAELTMGLLSRAAPALNIFALAFPVRIGVTLVVTAIALPLIAPALTNLVRDAVRIGLGG